MCSNISGHAAQLSTDHHKTPRNIVEAAAVHTESHSNGVRQENSRLEETLSDGHYQLLGRIGWAVKSWLFLRTDNFPTAACDRGDQQLNHLLLNFLLQPSIDEMA